MLSSIEVYKQKINTYFKKYKKQILLNYLVFFIVLIVFTSIDQIIKTFVFKHGNALEIIKEGQHAGKILSPDGYSYINPESIWPINQIDWNDYGIIGIRSIWHRGVTFLSTRNIALIQTLSMFIFVLLVLFPLFNTKNGIFNSFFIGMIAAGDLGNMLDRFIFDGHVKDMFYTPFLENWLDRQLGTFNFADACVFVGMILIFLSTFIFFIVELVSKNKKKKTGKIIDDDTSDDIPTIINL